MICSSLCKESITSYEEKIDEQLAKMYEKQEKYYQQFASMESLLSSYQSQSQWLTQQLGMS